MSRIIKETPILKGKDAIMFQKRIDNVQKIPIEERKIMQENFHKLQSISRF